MISSIRIRTILCFRRMSVAGEFHTAGRSCAKLQSVSLSGIRLALAGSSLSRNRTADAAWSFYRTLENRVRGLPGVQSVCYASKAPFWGDDEGPEATGEVRLPGQPKGAGHRASVDVVSTDF